MNGNKKQNKKMGKKTPYGARILPDGDTISSHCKDLILPTAPNQFGRTALIDSDFNSKVLHQLQPFNTIGNQKFLWRSQYDVQIMQQAAGDVQGNVVFALTNFNGASDYTNVFDQYRLKVASVRFDPMYDSSLFVPPNVNPRLFSCIDYDDANGITAGQLLQYDTAVESPAGTGHVRTLLPRMALAAYSGAFTSYANVADQWIDVASNSVHHYGVKYVVASGNAGQTILQNFIVHVEAFWEFRASR
jgi:hypothetical protein